MNFLGRRFVATLTQQGTSAEQKLLDKLVREFEPKALQIEDISGGCGSMFQVSIQSHKFKDLSTVKQHKLVYSCLADEMKAMHGLQLTTLS